MERLIRNTGVFWFTTVKMAITEGKVEDEGLYTVGVNANYYNHYGNQYEDFERKRERERRKGGRKKGRERGMGKKRKKEDKVRSA